MSKVSKFLIGLISLSKSINFCFSEVNIKCREDLYQSISSESYRSVVIIITKVLFVQFNLLYKRAV